MFSAALGCVVIVCVFVDAACRSDALQSRTELSALREAGARYSFGSVLKLRSKRSDFSSDVSVVDEYFCGTTCTWRHYCYATVFTNDTGVLSCLPCINICDVNFTPELRNETSPYLGLSADCFHHCHGVWSILVNGSSPTEKAALQDAPSASVILYVDLLDFRTRAWGSAIAVVVFLIILALAVKTCMLLQDKFADGRGIEEEFILSEINQSQSYGTEENG
ncbi:hypothetical protein CAPTEDRAFT_197205 [Capitella teleta]|uniref:TNFR-Cys domain-containing protein n=1 Tax=Capitella teleta TaxID=283909 RepID=R7UC72_CAPTE|nr:hypothetical protein CAPTEDRAFT_197205 [Capitella teleta]|eukprot:ELU03950.1 hypothetical protein CAPTEDRAFT_197205 [Capitella teleta]